MPISTKKYLTFNIPTLILTLFVQFIKYLKDKQLFGIYLI